MDGADDHDLCPCSFSCEYYFPMSIVISSSTSLLQANPTAFLSIYLTSVYVSIMDGADDHDLCPCSFSCEYYFPMSIVISSSTSLLQANPTAFLSIYLTSVYVSIMDGADDHD